MIPKLNWGALSRNYSHLQCQKKPNVILLVRNDVVIFLFDYRGVVYQHEVLLHTAVAGQYHMRVIPYSLNCIHLLSAYVTIMHNFMLPMLLTRIWLYKTLNVGHNLHIVQILQYVSFFCSLTWNQSCGPAFWFLNGPSEKGRRGSKDSVKKPVPVHLPGLANALGNVYTGWWRPLWKNIKLDLTNVCGE